MGLINVSIRRPLFIFMIFLATIVLGSFAYNEMGVDLFPDIEFPVVLVTVGWPGASNTEVEQQVTQEVEDAVASLAKLKRVLSTTFDGTMQVVVEFELGTDLKDAQNRVRNNVERVKINLPDEAQDNITYDTFNPNASPVIIYALSSNRSEVTGGLEADYSPEELYDRFEDVMKEPIERIDGVASVGIIGGRDREIHVDVSKAKLEAANVTLRQVQNALENVSLNVPAGEIARGSRAFTVTTEGEFETLDDIRNTEVARFPNGDVVLLKTVATVSEGLEDKRSMATFGGRPAIQFYILKQSGTNVVEVANNVRNEIFRLTNDPALNMHRGVSADIIVDFSVFIEQSINGVQTHLIEGAILATIVVFLFLWNIRSTVITFMALPNSIIGTFLIIWILGYTQNFMTMLALLLAIGLLIDDAIVVRENIYRHLAMGRSPREAARIGTKEVALAVVATTSTIIAVFLPVSLMEGVVGQFFQQFGITVVVAMLISLFDAFTMAPMLSSRFLAPPEGKAGWWTRFEKRGERWFNRNYGKVVKFYDRVLTWSLHHRRAMIAMGVGSFLFAAVMFVVVIPKGFFSAEERAELSVAVANTPGASYQSTEAIMNGIRDELASIDWVKFAMNTVGDRFENTDRGDVAIVLKPKEERFEPNVSYSLRQRMGLLGPGEELEPGEVGEPKDLKGFSSEVAKAIIRERLEVFTGTNIKVAGIDAFGSGNDFQNAPFSYMFFHDDYDTLERATRVLFERLRQIPGTEDVDSSVKEPRTKYEFQLDRSLLVDRGLNTISIGLDAQAALNGRTVAKLKDGEEELDIIVRFEEDDRASLADLETLKVSSVTGEQYLYGSLGEFELTAAPRSILRQDRQRYTWITSQFAPWASLSDVQGRFEQIVEEVKAENPEFQSLRLMASGEAENFEELMQNIILALSLALVFIYMILAALYESFIHPFTILASIPLSFIGAVLGIWITGYTMDIFAFIGLILLVGLVTKNAILLIDYANQLRAKGFPIFAALRLAGPTRLRPILMTSAALIAAMIPLALAVGSGNEGQQSMAIVIIGGLISSTVLTLVFVPALYVMMDSMRVWASRHLFNGYKVPKWSGLSRFYTAIPDYDDRERELSPDAQSPMPASSASSSS